MVTIPILCKMKYFLQQMVIPQTKNKKKIENILGPLLTVIVK